VVRVISISFNQDLKQLKAYIERRDEAVPGEMAQELGWARTSLAYNLNRLLKNGFIVGWATAEASGTGSTGQ